MFSSRLANVLTPVRCTVIALFVKCTKRKKSEKIFTNKQEFEGAMENIINTNPTDSKPARRKDVSPMAHHGQR